MANRAQSTKSRPAPLTAPPIPSVEHQRAVGPDVRDPRRGPGPLGAAPASVRTAGRRSWPPSWGACRGSPRASPSGRCGGATSERACQRTGPEITWQERQEEASLRGQRGVWPPRLILRPRLSPQAVVASTRSPSSRTGWRIRTTGGRRCSGAWAWSCGVEAYTLGYLALFPHRGGRRTRCSWRRAASSRRGSTAKVCQPTRHRDGHVTWATRTEVVDWYPALPLPEDKPWFADGGAWSEP